MSKLTHFNEQGAAHVVDIGDKSVTQRIAIASNGMDSSSLTRHQGAILEEPLTSD